MGKSNRSIYAVTGVIVLLCDGLIYAWSIMSAPIAIEFPTWSNTQLSFTFTIVMIMFSAGGIIGGILSKKLKPGYYLRISGLLFLIGFGISSRAQNLSSLYIAFGCVCGFACGFAYNAVISTVNKWFTDKQGFISGILLMGFGFGSFFVGKIFQALTPSETGGWRISFVILGVVVFCVMIFASFILKSPPDGYICPARNNNLKKPVNSVAIEAPPAIMLRHCSFWLCLIWSSVLFLAGVAIVSNANGIAMEIGSDRSSGTIATVVGLISIFNGIGRVIMGSTYDRLGRAFTMHMSNISFLIAAFILFTAQSTHSFILLIAGFICCGFAYSGVSPVISAFVNSYFGSRYYPTNYSIINLCALVGAFGSTIVGALYDATHSYLSTYIMVGTMAAVGILTAFGISISDKNLIKRKEI